MTEKFRLVYFEIGLSSSSTKSILFAQNTGFSQSEKFYVFYKLEKLCTHSYRVSHSGDSILAIYLIFSLFFIGLLSLFLLLLLCRFLSVYSFVCKWNICIAWACFLIYIQSDRRAIRKFFFRHFFPLCLYKYTSIGKIFSLWCLYQIAKINSIISTLMLFNVCNFVCLCSFDAFFSLVDCECMNL